MSIRIIIADDHRVFIDGMKSLLKEFPMIEVIGEAENGKQLLEQVEALQPDIVLTDIQMPLMDGIAASREIHKRFPGIKIIALTMLNESVYIKKMLEAGVSGYLIKTVDKEELIRVIQKVAGGEKHFGEEVTNRLLHNFTGRSQAGENPADILTRREKEILSLIAQGLTDKEIAEKVHLSSLTIISHRKNILGKLGLKNKVELTRFAIEHNLVP
ncbi:MAG: LuxR family transcriptional regulator [Bacteroidetes bacterium]|nr:MAG: LuxR family transcriptional regulator [Bacteroidota bacterium]